MTDRAREVAAGLRAADRKGMLTRDGQGAYSSAVWKRLSQAGLVDGCFCFTRLGFEVKRILEADNPARP